MKLQACLNGARPLGAHPALPQTPAQLALNAASAVLAGAEAIHMHVWQAGHETLDADWVGETLRQVWVAEPGIPIGISTGLWIVASAPERLTHGVDDHAWALLKAAGKRGDAARIGLEDTLLLPDGSAAPDKAALVRSALQLLTAR